MCADRFDYTLRYFAHIGGNDFVTTSLSSAINRDSTILFTSFPQAREFAIRHLKVWNGVLGGYGELYQDMRVRYYLLSSALIEAIETGLIKRSDFDGSDLHVMKKLEASKSKSITRILNVLKNDMEFELSDSRKNQKVILFSKFRYVDPIYLTEGKARRVSDTDVEFEKLVKEVRERNKAGVGIASIKGIELPILPTRSGTNTHEQKKRAQGDLDPRHTG